MTVAPEPTVLRLGPGPRRRGPVVLCEGAGHGPAFDAEVEHPGDGCSRFHERDLSGG